MRNMDELAEKTFWEIPSSYQLKSDEITKLIDLTESENPQNAYRAITTAFSYGFALGSRSKAGDKMSERIRISLEAARVNAKMAQPHAAQALGVSVTTILKWEKGVTMPPVDKAIALAELYSIPMDSINFCPQT